MSKLSNTNKILLLELETYLKRFDEVQKETTFNKNNAYKEVVPL